MRNGDFSFDSSGGEQNGINDQLGLITTNDFGQRQNILTPIQHWSGKKTEAGHP